jgi:hypothetical protein
LLSLPGSGAGSTGAGGAGVSEGFPGIVVGATPGGSPVGAGADLPGGSLSGPLMPHPTSATSAVQAMIAGMERRKMPDSVNGIFMRYGKVYHAEID